MLKMVAIAAAVMACAWAGGCNRNTDGDTGMTTTAKATIEVTSAFKSGEHIPKHFSGEGENVSPAVKWSAVPEGTRELVLLVHDPDAPRGDFVHWVLYNIPPQMNSLPENVSKTDKPQEIPGAAQGVNSGGQLGYMGPMPPRGHGMHHYHFQVFALDKALDLKPGLTRDEVMSKIKGHIIASGELVGTYERN